MASPGFSFLVSPDSQLLADALDGLIKAHPAPGGQWERLVFWGDEEPGQRFWENLNQQGLFASYRVLVVRHAQEWPAAVWKSVSAALGRSHEGVWPVFCLESEFEKGKFKIPDHLVKTRCYAFAEKNGWVERHPPLAGVAMRKYVEACAKKRGLKLDGQALNLFCECVRPDARSIVNELDKLRLLSERGEVTPAMISRESSTPESDAFACVKKLEIGDLAGAWREMSRNVSSSMLFFMIALMSRELRLLWQMQSGAPAPRMHPAEAAAKSRLAKSLDRQRVASGFCALADAELAVKSGRLAPEQALEKFLVDMWRVFRIA